MNAFIQIFGRANFQNVSQKLATATTLVAFAIVPALVPSTGAAKPSKAEVEWLVRNSYHPAIEVSSVNTGFSLFGCRMKQVTIKGRDPVDGTMRDVIVKEYSAGSKAARTVLVLPPTGGENVLDNGYANELCRSGFRALLVQSWKDDTLVELDMGMHDRGALRAISAIRHVVEYATSTPSAPKTVGILGTSVGAISSALVMGIDSRITTGILIVAGAGMSEVIAASTEKGLTDLRKRRFAAHGFAGVAEYERALSEKVHIEPLDFAKASKARTLHVVATADVTVPTKNQWDLYDALGRQEVITSDANHFNTILFASMKLKSRFIAFFTENL